MSLENELLKLKEELVSIRRHLHQTPELGLEEYETSLYIKKYLSNEGIKFESCFKTGVCAIIEGTLKTNTKKVIGVRADMDALPIQDMKTCPYKSKNKGIMHACGHDAHVTILLGVAKVLNRLKDYFSGTVKLIFEPAEETVGGARFMIEEGVLENPKVDVMIGLHVEESLPTGKIKVRDGMVNAASNPFKVKISGYGGHGAYPSEAIDPIVAVGNIIVGLQTLVSREINPTNPSVLTIGNIYGGKAQNVIPGEAGLSGIMRTLTPEDRKYIVRRFEDMVDGIAKAFRCKAEIDIEESYPCLTNDSNMVNLLKKSASSVIGSENVLYQDKVKMGVESFSYFASEIPSVFYFLGCGNKDKNIKSPSHNALFDIDEDCLSIGVAIQCQTVLDYLNS